MENVFILELKLMHAKMYKELQKIVEMRFGNAQVNG